MVSVAQLVRALGCGSRGRGFKSHHSPFFLCFMARVIGIDYGRRRVGIAVSDPLQIIASPLVTVVESGVLDFLSKYVQKEKVSTIVVGYPIGLSGGVTDMCVVVDKFVSRLKRGFPDICIVTHDERFTSVMARDSLVMGGVGKKRRSARFLVNAVSATFILRSFLAQYSKVD